MYCITGFVGFLVAIHRIQSNILWCFKKSTNKLYTAKSTSVGGFLWCNLVLQVAVIWKCGLQGLNQSQDDESDYSDAPNSSNVSKLEAPAISVCCSDGAEKTTCRVYRLSAFLTLKDRGNLFELAASVNISVHWERKMFSANVQHQHEVGYHKVKGFLMLNWYKYPNNI